MATVTIEHRNVIMSFEHGFFCSVDNCFIEKINVENFKMSISLNTVDLLDISVIETNGPLYKHLQLDFKSVIPPFEHGEHSYRLQNLR